jgi:hypothetical protein
MKQSTYNPNISGYIEVIYVPCQIPSTISCEHVAENPRKIMAALLHPYLKPQPYSKRAIKTTTKTIINTQPQSRSNNS